MKKRPNYLHKIVVITKLKFIIPFNILHFAQICSRQASKCTIFFNFQKWPKYLISGKQFRKSPIGNSVLILRHHSAWSGD